MLELKKFVSPQGHPVRIYAVDGGITKREIHAAAYTQRSGWTPMQFDSVDEFFDLGYKEHNPLNDLKIDDPVIVWNDSLQKRKRHFAGISPQGEIITFQWGTTSFSGENLTTTWPHWELP